MLRLPTFCMLLALATAQNGYEYNKPRNPFPPSSLRPGYQTGGYPTSTSYPGRQPNDDYSGTSTQGYSGFPGSSSQRPQSSFPGQGSSYPGQGPTGPDGYSGQNGQSYPSGFGPGGPGFGPGENRYRPGFPGFGPGSEDTGEYVGGDYSAIPGQPDIDYPILSYIPSTSFSCESQSYPGYYSDVETRCQVFHVCANNKTYDFLCPNGTIFSQEFFVCVWWDQFECNSAPSLYGLNANLYDYSIKGSQVGYPGAGINGYSPGPGSSRPSGPGYSTSTQYPGSHGPYGPSTSGPGSSYPGTSPSNYPSSSYPSGKPSGPGFSNGSGRPAHPPNREYLPPN